MDSDQSLFYRLGYALERARQTSRQAPSQAGDGLRGLAKRREPEAPKPPVRLPETEEVLTSVALIAISKVLDRWRPRGRTGPLRLLGSLAAGAGAALVVELIRPLLRGGPVLELDRTTADRLLAGAGQGLLYGAAVEPRVPGPPLLKGVLYGSVEYAVDAAGGLSRLLGAHAPHRHVPFLGDLLEGAEPHERLYLEHVIFGVTLATLYGVSPSSNGASHEDDEDE